MVRRERLFLLLPLLRYLLLLCYYFASYFIWRCRMLSCILLANCVLYYRKCKVDTKEINTVILMETSKRLFTEASVNEKRYGLSFVC